MKTIFVKNSFVDFTQNSHSFTIAGVVATPKELKIDIEDDLYKFSKILTIGISICKPIVNNDASTGDVYIEKKGEKQAEGRAIKFKNRIVTFNKSFLCTQNVVNSILENVALDICNNPELYIKGYNNAKKHFIESNKNIEEASNNA